MFINLKAKIIFKSIKIYSLKQKNRKIIDIIFNKLHSQNKMHYIIQSTSFNYFVFVMWKNISQERKNKAVIDIRDFNDITEINSYSLFLQSTIITSVIEYLYIFTINVVGWFHQFNVRESDRHKLTMINHRDQKKSNVTFIKYKNSLSYVQR